MPFELDQILTRTDEGARDKARAAGAFIAGFGSVGDAQELVAGLALLVRLLRHRGEYPGRILAAPMWSCTCANWNSSCLGRPRRRCTGRFRR